MPNGCWRYTGWLGHDGYGYIRVKEKNRLVHRVSYEVFRGPIPSGYELDHECHDPKTCPGGLECPHRACINPDHLEPATGAHNHSRARANYTKTQLHIANEAKTHCPMGHSYDMLNTRIIGTSRSCKECTRANSRKYQRQRRMRQNQQQQADLLYDLIKLALGPWLR